jgi:hypothetical protein
MVQASYENRTVAQSGFNWATVYHKVEKLSNWHGRQAGLDKFRLFGYTA